MDGRVGFFVVTPLRSSRGATSVLVQRGWVAARLRRTRTALPPVPTPDGVVAVDGRVAPPPSRLFEFAGAASGPIRQNLDLASFAREIGLTLLPLVGRRSSDAPAPPATACCATGRRPAADVQKHYGYAFQWFAIAARASPSSMSGSDSSAPATPADCGAARELHRPLAAVARATPRCAAPSAARRLMMLLVLLVCAAPVIASYFTYFVLRPAGARTNYGELIEPPRPLPAALPLRRPRRRAGRRRRR